VLRLLKIGAIQRNGKQYSGAFFMRVVYHPVSPDTRGVWPVAPGGCVSQCTGGESIADTTRLEPVTRAIELEPVTRPPDGRDDDLPFEY
jgi:hypothetical protein